MFGIGGTEIVVLAVCLIPASVVPVVALWRILSRAGLNRWLALVAIVPFFTPLLLLFVAFASWPTMAHSSK